MTRKPKSSYRCGLQQKKEQQTQVLIFIIYNIDEMFITVKSSISVADSFDCAYNIDINSLYLSDEELSKLQKLQTQYGVTLHTIPLCCIIHMMTNYIIIMF
uniref:Uncharacterized protein n=1 Tax=viral metagenome TaxID=1070528 RepID=A0A6C0J785_9ZZZZ